jgi:hypothetical protein
MGAPSPEKYGAAVRRVRACLLARPTSPGIGSGEGLEKCRRRVPRRRTPNRVWIGRSGHLSCHLCARAGARGAPMGRDGGCARGRRPLGGGRPDPEWRASHRAKPATQRAERRQRTALARARPWPISAGHRTRGAYGKAKLATYCHITPFAELRSIHLTGRWVKSPPWPKLAYMLAEYLTLDEVGEEATRVGEFIR